MRRHLLLVGLPGVGKSTIGRQVAEALGAPLFDIDSLLVREMGMPLAQIFGMVGEPRFREMEQKAVLAAAEAEEPAVIVPGAGWAAQPGQVHSVRAFALLIYLRCLPGTAAKRSENGEVRPLLVGVDPMETMRQLLEVREPFYKLADFEIASERSLDEVVGGVVELARRHGGW